MSIDKRLDDSLGASAFLEDREEFDNAFAKARGIVPELEIEIVEADEFGATPDEEGGILIDFSEGEEEVEVEFGANLAEHVDDQALGKLSSELVSSYEGDKSSRKDWAEAYEKGLGQLGLKHEPRTSPWEGACGVTHPILSEAVVRFQSQAIGEVWPAGGPVRTKIVGKVTAEKSKQANRLREYMNYLVQSEMKEYREETEKLLFSLPLAGSAFRKVYWSETLGRPCAMFVPSEDMIVNYGASSLETAERVTQVFTQSRNEILKLQRDGWYRECDLGEPATDLGGIQKKVDSLTGEEPDYQSDAPFTLLEMHVDIDLEGFEDCHEGCPTEIGLPYVVTVELGSSKILSIRRNWFEDDEKKLKREHFVQYSYIPGLGFYGLGLIHLIGGLASSATSILRQLTDAGTLSNLPGGLKSRGLRILGDDTPISPGEFRDVDVPGGAIRDNITFLPYKEPSGVLYQLLGTIVEEGRRFASLTDLNTSDMNSEAPVGTTLALIERSMKVMNSITARLHASMRREFDILTGIVRDHAPAEYPYALDGKEQMIAEDFSDAVDILPVSDPNASTMAQRLMQMQSALQLAATDPTIYDMPALHRQALEVMGIKDVEEIIPMEDEIPVMEPVTENMAMLNGKPVEAFMFQDHEAHITVHMAASQDPQIMEILQQSPNAASIQSALMAHVTAHLGFRYRRQIEEQLGIPLPPPDEPLPDQVEVQLSKLVADAAVKLQQQQAAQQQQQEAQQQAEDPIIQMRQAELAIREQEAQSKIASAQAKTEIDAAKVAMQENQMRMKADQDSAKMQLDGLRMADDSIRAKSELESKAAMDAMQMEMKTVQMMDDSVARKSEIDSREAIAHAQIAKDLFKSILDAELRGADLQTREILENAKLVEKFSEALMEDERSKAKEEREISERVRRDVERDRDVEQGRDREE